MHRILCGCAVIAAVALGSPALGAVVGAPPAFGSDTNAAQPATTGNPNEIVCKSAAPETGTSLLRRQICMTRTEWQQMEVNNREQITDLQTRSLAVPPHQ